MIWRANQRVTCNHAHFSEDFFFFRLQQRSGNTVNGDGRNESQRKTWVFASSTMHIHDNVDDISSILFLSTLSENTIEIVYWHPTTIGGPCIVRTCAFPNHSEFFTMSDSKLFHFLNDFLLMSSATIGIFSSCWSKWVLRKLIISCLSCLRSRRKKRSIAKELGLFCA